MSPASSHDGKRSSIASCPYSVRSSIPGEQGGARTLTRAFGWGHSRSELLGLCRDKRAAIWFLEGYAHGRAEEQKSSTEDLDCQLKGDSSGCCWKCMCFLKLRSEDLETAPCWSWGRCCRGQGTGEEVSVGSCCGCAGVSLRLGTRMEKRPI